LISVGRTVTIQISKQSAWSNVIHNTIQSNAQNEMLKPSLTSNC
jgi:hypothetical protein